MTLPTAAASEEINKVQTKNTSMESSDSSTSNPDSMYFLIYKCQFATTRHSSVKRITRIFIYLYFYNTYTFWF